MTSQAVPSGNASATRVDGSSRRDGSSQMGLTLKEAAALLDVTPDNLRQSIARGTFKATKLGRDWIVEPAEVEKYRTEHRRVRP